MSEEVRARFAPSPTGPLHIGGVRTALFNYLFARNNNGKFILRVEDTDQARLIPGAEKYIIESLRWCGIQPDEGGNAGGPYAPYRQSERKNLYDGYAHKLLNKGNAYIAFDTPEELDNIRKQYESEQQTFAYNSYTRDKLRNSLTLSPEEVSELIDKQVPYVVRFKMPGGDTVSVVDIIRGEVTFTTSMLDDKVLFKSDGLPTYHLANVVDDHTMKISHVIRGEEWLPSLPLHVLLYKALGWEDEMPRFAHLPLILKPGGKGKLSKRDGEREGFPVFPLEWRNSGGEITTGYREWGYFPEAFVNMLALLGWNPGTEQEIFSMEELISHFKLERVGKAGSRFDPEKTRWFNQQYLQMKSDAELADMFQVWLQENHKVIKADKGYIIKIVGIVKERAAFIHDLWDQSYFFFRPPAEYDQKVVKKFWKDHTPGVVSDIKKIIEETDPYTADKLENRIKMYITDNELGFGKVMNPLRLLLVGGNFGPHLFDIMALIGREETLKRIGRGLEKLQ